MKKNNIAPSLIALIFVALITFSCKNDTATGLFKNHETLAKLNKTYQDTSNITNGNNLIKEVMNVLSTEKLDVDLTKQYLEYGLKVASDQNITSRKAFFLMALIKGDYANAETANRIFDLSQIMFKMKKETVSNTLSKSLIDNFPSFDKLDVVKSQLPDSLVDINAYIAVVGQKIFEDPDNTGINRNASLAYVDACEAFAIAYPTSEKTPDYLFKAAEVAKSLRTFPKSLTLYDWIIEKYPNYEKASTSLFLKGFIIENNLGDDVKAKEVYDEFLLKYPKHDLADDVQFLIENLGKTDEEILQMIEAKQKK